MTAASVTPTAAMEPPMPKPPRPIMRIRVAQISRFNAAEIARVA